MENLDLLCLGCMRMKMREGRCPHCHFELGEYQEQKRKEGMQFLEPQTILNGKYLIGKVLGKGGFGITYIGWNLSLQMRVAIKEYFPSGLVMRNARRNGTVSVLSESLRPTYLRRKDKFLQEARILGKLEHMEGVVSVRDFFEENGTAYIVMEYLDGEDFGAFIEKYGGKLPPQKVFEMMVPVMKALSAIHKQNLIHRDISPDNILITKDLKKIKLIDFGAAREVSDGKKDLSVILKPGYAPEEQYREKGIQGPWTDVYALCATMYRAITGEKPVESLKRVTEISKADGERLKRPSEFGIRIDKRQEQVLMKGLEVLAENRWRSMEQLYQALGSPRFTGIYTGSQQGIKETFHEKEKQILKQRRYVVPDKQQKIIQDNPKDNLKKDSQENKTNIALVIALCVLIAVVGVGIGSVAVGVISLNQKEEANNKNSNPSNDANDINDGNVSDSDNIEGLAPKDETYDTSMDGSLGRNLKASEIEAEVLKIRELYRMIEDAVDSGKYNSIMINSEVTASYDGDNDVRRIVTTQGYNNIDYDQYYYYEGGVLRFVYYKNDAADAHRLYFYNQNLFRWRYCQDTANNEDAINHDLENSDEYLNLENVARSTGRSLYRLCQ